MVLVYRENGGKGTSPMVDVVGIHGLPMGSRHASARGEYGDPWGSQESSMG